MATLEREPAFSGPFLNTGEENIGERSLHACISSTIMLFKNDSVDNTVNGNSTLSPENFNFPADVSHKIDSSVCKTQIFQFSSQ
jgi:hypothetical protein